MLIEESMAVEIRGEGKEVSHKLRRLESLYLSPKTTREIRHNSRGGWLNTQILLGIRT